MMSTLGLSFGCLCIILANLVYKLVKVGQTPPHTDARRDSFLLCHSFGTIAVSLTWISLAILMTVLTKKIRKSLSVFNE